MGHTPVPALAIINPNDTKAIKFRYIDGDPITPASFESAAKVYYGDNIEIAFIPISQVLAAPETKEERDLYLGHLVRLVDAVNLHLEEVESEACYAMLESELLRAKAAIAKE